MTKPISEKVVELEVFFVYPFELGQSDIGVKRYIPITEHMFDSPDCQHLCITFNFHVIFHLEDIQI